MREICCQLPPEGCDWGGGRSCDALAGNLNVSARLQNSARRSSKTEGAGSWVAEIRFNIFVETTHFKIAVGKRGEKSVGELKTSVPYISDADTRDEQHYPGDVRTGCFIK